MIDFKHEDFDAIKIADSGQCFRMTVQPDGAVQAIAQGRRLLMWRLSHHIWRLSCSEQEFQAHWYHYFDLQADYGQYRAKCKKHDHALQQAIACGKGIRILNQCPWEMLVSFIISQRKSIPAIRSCIELLCSKFGTQVQDAYGVFFDFPTPAQLACASVQQLAACGLGYRVPYIQAAAQRALQQPCLEHLQVLDTPALRAELMRLPGVGIKVAECVALFGYHRLEAFPIDVWIDRVLHEWYNGTLPPSYRKCAGVLQQYLFCFARAQQLKKSASAPLE